MSFFYHINGDKMKIYIEALMLFNVYIDFLILVMIKTMQKKQFNFKRIFTASTIGGLSTILLFVKIPVFLFLITQLILSVFIVLIAFGRRKLGSNILHFYLNGILLGGLILAFNNIYTLNYQNNFTLLILLTPLLFIIHKHQIKNLKINYNLHYQARIKINNQIIKLNSFFDTGNNLIDPYFKRPVILVNENLIKSEEYFFIPYNTITETGILKAIAVDELEIEGVKTISKIVVGLLPNKLKLKEIDCLLNNRILEELNA